MAPNIAENALEEKANKTKKSEIYYDRNAKDLNELKPRDVIRVKPERLVKGQEWKKGSVINSHGYRSYAVVVEGKVLRRNCTSEAREADYTNYNRTQVQSKHASSCSTEHKSQAFKTDDPEEHGTREVRHKDGTDHC